MNPRDPVAGVAATTADGGPRSLADQIAELLAAAAPKRVAPAGKAAAAIAASGQAPGLEVGDRAPDFTLPGPLGESVRLADRLREGPVVLCFYRGGAPRAT